MVEAKIGTQKAKISMMILLQASCRSVVWFCGNCRIKFVLDFGLCAGAEAFVGVQRGSTLS